MVPTRLTRGEATKLFFRVRRPIEHAHVRIIIDGVTALEGKSHSFVPRIMESFPMSAKLASAAGKMVEIHVVTEDERHE